MKKFFKIVFVLVLLASNAHADDVQEGLKALERGDYKTAFQKWQRLAQKGNSIAQFNLGLMYDKGDGVRQSFPKAVKWYRKAAKQENVVRNLTLA
tara:strand:- start:184 stop:468 length:285 start_codon:yes stop_codon:yes gene_type:complete